MTEERSARIIKKKLEKVITLSDYMKEYEQLKFRLLQQRMVEAPTYLTALYFKLQADGVLYRAERQIRRKSKGKQKLTGRKGC